MGQDINENSINVKNELMNLINNSGLSQDNNESFIYFLEDVSDENCKYILEFLRDDSAVITLSWVTLRAKIGLMEELDHRGEIVETELITTKKKIALMSDEEFKIFTDTIDVINSEDDLIQKKAELQKEEIDLHNEFMDITDKLLNKIKTATTDTKQSNDEKDYQKVLDKIQN